MTNAETRQELDKIHNRITERGKENQEMAEKITRIETFMFGTHGQNGLRSDFNTLSTKVDSLTNTIEDMKAAQKAFRKVMTALYTALAVALTVVELGRNFFF